MSCYNQFSKCNGCAQWPKGRKVSTTANANCHYKKCYVKVCCPPKRKVPECRKSYKDDLRNKKCCPYKVKCCCPCPVKCPVKKTKCKCPSSKDYLRVKPCPCPDDCCW